MKQEAKIFYTAGASGGVDALQSKEVVVFHSSCPAEPGTIGKLVKFLIGL